MFSAMSNHHQISHSPPLLPPPPQPFASHIERKWKPHLETAPNCPRCASSNTKFCYYNNYSLSQPRYFCKACRRYWTKGGSLRNVPVGGGCRKSRRAKSSRSSVLHAHSSDRLNSRKSDVATQSESNDGCSTGSDIDLAAVFARFLNSQNSDPPSEANALTSSPESFDPLDNLTAENSEIFFEGLSDLLLDEENQQQKQEIAGSENFPFGLQTEVGVVDELWQEAMAMPSCSFSWQPQIQLQDHHFDSFACNSNANQLRVSDQFCQVGDNWSSFDVAAGFEVLSTP